LWAVFAIISGTMSLWRIKRQLLYLLLFILVIVAPITAYIILEKPAPSCFDGKKNQGEFGVDCGGSCAGVCESEVADLIVEWQRIFQSRPGEYYLAAFVENPNIDFTASHFDYIFEVYDRDNNLILTKKGISYSNPRGRFIIFEPKITFDGGAPEKVFLEIENIKWERSLNYMQPQISVRNEKLAISQTPKLTAILINEDSKDFEGLEISAVVFNEEDNVIAVSRTIINSLPRDKPEGIFFVWPAIFKEEPRICLNPVEAMLVFDRSGSMNDDNINPPQPLTDAQNAAKTFINQMSSRDKIGLVSFATEATFPVDQSLTTDRQAVKRAVGDIEIFPEEERGSTNLGDGIEKGLEELEKSINKEMSKEVLIVLTDGKANVPVVPGGEEYAIEKTKVAKSLGHEIYTIGLGESVNQGFLRGMASTPEHYFFSATSKELNNIYNQIAQDVCPERIYLTGIFVRQVNADF
jgi:Mg-chelatase subunit ChlD